MPGDASRKDRKRPSRNRQPLPTFGHVLTISAPEASAGDFIFVPPYVPHQEINASSDGLLECVLVRSDNEAVMVNLDIEQVEKPEAVTWIDPIHKA